MSAATVLELITIVKWMRSPINYASHHPTNYASNKTSPQVERRFYSAMKPD